MTLDKVFYPAPEENPGMGLFGNLAGHCNHPLHPNFNPPMQRVGGVGLLSGGLLSGEQLRFEPEFIDYDGERLKQAGRIAEHWQAIKSNKAYQLLTGDENFRKAHAAFERKQQAEDCSPYAHPFAAFRFVESVSSNIGWFLLTNGKAFDWPTPDGKATRKARGHVWAILDGIDKDGIRLQDYSKQSSLKSLLNELGGQLDVQYKTGRAEWGGKNRPYRILIQTLAVSLRRHFGEVSPEIVLSLTAMVDCPFSEKTINNQLNKVKNSSKNG